jgi:tetratricopeptide (TPR) repeat protein
MTLWQADYEGALAEIEAALAISPNLADAHGVLGSVLNWSGRRKEARVALEKSIRLDPRNPNLAIRLLAVTVNSTGPVNTMPRLRRRSGQSVRTRMMAALIAGSPQHSARSGE